VSDLSKISQILKLLALLETNHLITKRELAERLDTNVRNIKAYLEDMKDAGIQVESISGCRGGHFLASSSILKPPTLDEGEYSALLLAEKLLTQKNGFFMENELKTAIAKIKWALGDTSTNFTPDLPEEFIFSFGKKDSNNIKDIYELINESIVNKRCIEINYYAPSRDESISRIIHPYGMVYREGSWYVVGYCRLRQAVRMFKLVRIRSLEVLDETFRYPPDFSISAYMRDSFSLFQGKTYKVEIQFFHPASTFVKEKTWIASQKILELKDGSIIFKARVKGLTEIKNWVMSFGSLALAREPQELVDEVRKEAQKIFNNYI